MQVPKVQTQQTTEQMLDQMWAQFMQTIMQVMGGQLANSVPNFDIKQFNPKMSDFDDAGGLFKDMMRRNSKDQFRQFKTAQVINGKIGFGNPTDGNDNMDGVWNKGVTPVVPDTEFAIIHNLRRVPTGFIVFSQDKAGTVYKGDTPWSSTQMFLKASSAQMAITIFIS